jgi:lipopolysaccharide/colanic/teichoic acid biosynthesis glycosyltransferase
MYFYIKFFFDFLFTIAIIPILTPLFIIISIILKIESPSENIFFVQERIGYKNKRFKLFKFRTMKNEDNPRDDFTNINDKRITYFGRVLRQTRLDEIPQFINIFMGNMSLIGPRPEQPHYVDDLVKKYGSKFNKRHIVRPGITGLAQVEYGYVSDLDDYVNKMNYDLAYVDEFGILIDLKIFFKTFIVMILRIGSR